MRYVSVVEVHITVSYIKIYGFDKKIFLCRIYRGADKVLVRPGRKQANVSVRMA